MNSKSNDKLKSWAKDALLIAAVGLGTFIFLHYSFHRTTRHSTNSPYRSAQVIRSTHTDASTAELQHPTLSPKHSVDTDSSPQSQATITRRPDLPNRVKESQPAFGTALLLKISGASTGTLLPTPGYQSTVDPNLFFSLREKALSDDKWKSLGQRQTLEVLELANSNLTDQRMMYLKDLRDLKGLDISKTHITDKGIAVLKDFPKLELLIMNGIDLSKTDAHSLSKLTALKELDISNTGINSKALSNLRALKQLENLRLESSNLSDTVFQSIAKMKQLQQLDLNKTNINDKQIKLLAPLTHLNDLRLQGTAITDNGVSTVGGFPLLTRLDLSSNRKIGDAGIAQLRGLKHLYWIGLGDTNVTNKALDVIGNFSTLEELGLRKTAVDDSQLYKLRNLPLKAIALRDSRVTLRGLKQLQEWIPGVQIDY